MFSHSTKALIFSLLAFDSLVQAAPTDREAKGIESLSFGESKRVSSVDSPEVAQRRELSEALSALDARVRARQVPPSNRLNNNQETDPNQPVDPNQQSDPNADPNRQTDPNVDQNRQTDPNAASNQQPQTNQPAGSNQPSLRTATKNMDLTAYQVVRATRVFSPGEQVTFTGDGNLIADDDYRFLDELKVQWHDQVGGGMGFNPDLEQVALQVYSGQTVTWPENAKFTVYLPPWNQ